MQLITFQLSLFAILDDPHNVIKAESDLERGKTVRFVRESMSNRLNDEQSAIVVIMQRLHEGDFSGDILARVTATS
jgi:hypothetical protein